MIYLSDIPSSLDLSNIYLCYGNFKGYFQNNAVLKPLSRRTLYSLARNHFAIQILEQFDGLKGFKFCEIGSSYGIILQIARFKGASVAGVELDEKARLFTTSKLGIPTYQSIEESSGLQDIVCAISVFEHLQNPAILVEEIYNKCSNDARLLLSMPNGENYHRYGPTWAGFRVDLEHLNYFSLNTISSLLFKKGFLIEQHWEINQLFTNRSTSPEGLAHRIISKFRRPTWNPQKQGSATLVVLARKV